MILNCSVAPETPVTPSAVMLGIPECQARYRMNASNFRNFRKILGIEKPGNKSAFTALNILKMDFAWTLSRLPKKLSYNEFAQIWKRNLKVPPQRRMLDFYESTYGVDLESIVSAQPEDFLQNPPVETVLKVLRFVKNAN